MNKLIALLLLVFAVSCTKTAQEVSHKEPAKKLTCNVPQHNFAKMQAPFKPDPYKIATKIEEGENGEKYLVIDMNLGEGSHYISPHEERAFGGKFTVAILENDMVMLGDELIEIPAAKKRYGSTLPFDDGNTKWVRENTVYKQSLDILTEDDFDVAGTIQFVIEPQCTLEVITFLVSSRDGKMTATARKRC